LLGVRDAALAAVRGEMSVWRPLVINPHRRGGFFSPPKRPVPTGRGKLPAANRPTVVRVEIGV
jgi:hypothetical protein